MGDIWKPPLLVVAHPTLFSAFEIDSFERDIIRNPNSTEHDASQFFERFPKFLFLGQGAEIRREVVMIGGSSSLTTRVDFFRRSYGNAFWDIIEIKGPHKRFITASSTQHPRLSSGVEMAIEQAEDSRDLIIQDASIRSNLLKKGILVYRPQILVVIGKDNEQVSPEVMQVLYDRVRRGPIEVRSYSDILKFAKEHYEATNVILFFGQLGSKREDISFDIILLERIRQELARLAPEGSRFPFSHGASNVEIQEFDPHSCVLEVRTGDCRYIEGLMFGKYLNTELKKTIPEINHVSTVFKEL